MEKNLFYLSAVCLLLFSITIGIVANDFKLEISGTYLFMHMEVGYTEQGRNVLPNPEYSGPNNTQALDDVYSKIESGVVEQAVRDVIEIMNESEKRGVFLAFPYFAEKHSEVLKEALSQGHLVGIHMHENWKLLTSEWSLDELTSYIKSEKNRLEKAIGSKVVIFSYGPGVELDDKLPFPTNIGLGQSLTDEEKNKFFQAIANAGFKFVTTALEYQAFVPSNLVILDNFGRGPTILIGLPHSYELISRNEVVWKQDSRIRGLFEQLYITSPV